MNKNKIDFWCRYYIKVYKLLCLILWMADLNVFKSVITGVSILDMATFGTNTFLDKLHIKQKHNVFNAIIIKYRHTTFLVSLTDTLESPAFSKYYTFFIEAAESEMPSYEKITKTIYDDIDSLQLFQLKVHKWLPQLNLVFFTIDDTLKSELSKRGFYTLRLEDMYIEPVNRFPITVQTSINAKQHTFNLERQAFPLLSNKDLGRTINYVSSTKIVQDDGSHYEGFHLITLNNKVIGFLDFVNDTTMNYVPMFVIHQVLKNKVTNAFVLPIGVTVKNDVLTIHKPFKNDITAFNRGDIITTINGFTLTREIMNDGKLCLPCDVYLKLIDPTKEVVIEYNQNGMNKRTEMTLYPLTSFNKIPDYMDELKMSTYTINNVTLMIGQLSLNFLELFEDGLCDFDFTLVRKIKNNCLQNLKTFEELPLFVLYSAIPSSDYVSTSEMDQLIELVNVKQLLMPVTELIECVKSDVESNLDPKAVSSGSIVKPLHKLTCSIDLRELVIMAV
jgi:hypothetical protein